MWFAIDYSVTIDGGEAIVTDHVVEADVEMTSRWLCEGDWNKLAGLSGQKSETT